MARRACGSWKQKAMKAESRARSDVLFDVVNNTLLVLVLLAVLYPLYFSLIASFSEPNYIYQGKVYFLPKGITFEGYQRIFQSSGIWQGYLNSLIYTTVGTTINVVLTTATAYPLSRKDLVGRKLLMILFTFTMVFSGGMIPTYLNVKNLGLINTIWAMVLPGAILVYNLIIARTFFRTTIPDELLESAMMDGCSNIRFFLRIVIPLAPTLIAVLVVFYGVNHWNAYFDALLYMSDKKKYPLQLVLRSILLQNESLIQMSMEEDPARLQRIADQIKYGIILIASAPMLLLYPFAQKYFVKGLKIGRAHV
jgi:putative aldouronate transport system permease protein